MGVRIIMYVVLLSWNIANNQVSASSQFNSRPFGTLTTLKLLFLFLFIVPARVSTIGRVIYVPQNSDLDLPCRIVGDPLPTRKWFKNGRELSSDGMLNHALSSSR